MRSMVATSVTLILIMVISGPMGNVSANSLSSVWANQTADIYFLLDSSSSVWIVDYAKMKTLVSDLISDMNIGPENTRVGVGIFSNEFKEYIAIDNTHTKEELMQAITDTPYMPGNTYTSRAIHGLRTTGLSPEKERKGGRVPLVAVLITDGISRHEQLTKNNATLAKREGVSMFTVGVGYRMGSELWSIASDPRRDHVFLVENFSKLQNIRNRLSRAMAKEEFLQGDQSVECGGSKEADILFVFDEATFGRKDSTIIKGFIADIAANLSMNSGKVRIGVISKICHGGSDINLGTYIGTKKFEQGLMKNEGGPGIADLLKRASFDGFLEVNGARSQVLRRIILILNEKLTKRSTVPAVASMAKRNALVEMFVIHIGSNYDKDVLGRIATSQDHVTYFDNAEYLGSPRRRPIFTEMFCTGL